MRRTLRVILVAAAVVLATGWVATRWLVSRAERAHPATGSFVQVDGFAQHILTAGPDKTPPERGLLKNKSPTDPISIVLVHGAFGSSDDFAATVLDELSTRYHCIAWDRPGHGYSERPLDKIVDPGVQGHMLLELLRTQALNRPLLVGFSFGASVVLAAALEDPDAIRGLLCINGLTHSWPNPITLAYRLPGIPVIGWLATETVITPLGHLMSEPGIAKAFAPEDVPPLFSRSAVGLALRPHSYRANSEDVRLVQPFLKRQSARYHQLAVPLTVLISDDDHVVAPWVHSLPLAKSAPDAATIHVQGAGHQLPYARPQIVIDAVDQAVRRSSDQPR